MTAIIRYLEEKDIEDLFQIGLVQLGEYLERSDFEDAMHTEGQFCKIVEYDGKAVGFAICKYFPPEDEKKNLDLPDCPERDEIMRMKLIGLLDSVAISKDMAGKGLGTLLVSDCIEVLKKQGCDYLCAMADTKFKTGVAPIAGIVKKSGFVETISIPGYWNRWVDSPTGHFCPECGCPCKCSGVLWKRLV